MATAQKIYIGLMEESELVTITYWVQKKFWMSTTNREGKSKEKAAVKTRRKGLAKKRVSRRRPRNFVLRTKITSIMP